MGNRTIGSLARQRSMRFGRALGLGCLLFLQGLNCPIKNRLKRGWILYDEIGQTLSIDRDIRSRQSFNEPAIGGPVFPASGVDSLNPKIPKIALSGFPVPISPILGLEGSVFRVPEQFGAPSSVTFRLVQDSFTAFSTSSSVGCSRHSHSPGLRAPLRQTVFFPTVPRPRLSVSEINPEGGQQVFPML